jgi:hypothetical protein
MASSMICERVLPSAKAADSRRSMAEGESEMLNARFFSVPLMGLAIKEV